MLPLLLPPLLPLLLAGRGCAPGRLANGISHHSFAHACSPPDPSYLAHPPALQPRPPAPLQLAAQLAAQYLRTAHAAWRQSGRMWEKFDARRAGAPGGGGEYAVVSGFGWTNGVALALLHRYGWAAEGEAAAAAAEAAAGGGGKRALLNP